ncbi:MAG: cell division protein FtsX [Armatimonadota bacterium]
MFSRIEFLVSETLLSLRRHPAMAFAATICVAAALFIAGIVGLAFLNANYLIDTQRSEFRFVVFFQPETSRQEAREDYDRISSMSTVDDAVFVPKENAWEKLKKADPRLVSTLNGNPYPDSVVVKPVDISDVPALKKQISRWSSVRKITVPTKVSDFLQSTHSAITTGGMFMGIILAVLSLVIIHHTIELTLYARRKEINIMSLVGATPATVALPFLMEGIIYGLVGGVIALCTLLPLYQYLMSAVWNAYKTHLLWGSPEMTKGVYVILIAGISLGLIGSAISVTKYLHRPRSKMTNA